MRSALRVVSVVCSLALVVAGCGLDEGGLQEAAAEDGAQALGLVSDIQIANDLLGKDDSVAVRWSLTNQGSETVSLPRWQVPGAELEEDLFAVTRDGIRVQYIGRIAKRMAPRAEDLVAIAPGATLSADIELSRFYRMASAGDYAIAQAGHGLAFTTGQPLSIELRSNPVSALRTEQHPNADAPIAEIVQPGFRSCSSSRQSQITTALNSAQTYAINAVNYLNAGTRGARYTTWFGTYDASRYNTVKSHFASIRDVVQNRAMTYDCSCTESGTFAYVYPSRPYTVYLCGAFWSTSNTGTDSRAGTIIHETSHFTVVAGTDDHVYGQSGAKNLARSSPSRAVDNADNHEYFAENTPSQN